MFQINAKRKRWLFVTTKLMNSLAKCVKKNIYVKLPTPISFFLMEIVLFLLEKLRKRCHKFTHILQLSQSYDQEDFNNCNTVSFCI